VSGATVQTEIRGELVCVTASAAASPGFPLALVATSCALSGGL